MNGRFQARQSGPRAPATDPVQTFAMRIPPPAPGHSDAGRPPRTQCENDVGGLMREADLGGVLCKGKPAS